MTNIIEQNAPAFLDNLPDRLVRQLKDMSTTKKYFDGQLIHSRGDDKPSVDVVRSGAIQVSTIGIDGSSITTSILGPGQIFGLITVFANTRRTHDISSVGETRIDQISGRDFMALFNTEPDLARALLVTSLGRTQVLLGLLDDIRRLPLPVRTAKLLHSMSKSSKDSETLICRQSELAFTLGVSRFSLGKALKILSEQGLVKLGYGKITIPRLAKLEDWIDNHSSVTRLV